MANLASRSQLRASLVRWVLFLVPLLLLLGFLSGEVWGWGKGNPWLAALVKPRAFPDPEMFRIVWNALFATMGFAAALVFVARGAMERRAALFFFAVQFVLNLVWPPIFFVAHDLRSALLLLGVIDAALLLALALFWRVRWLAGLLLLPSFAWLLFTTELNWEIFELNRHVDKTDSDGAIVRIELKRSLGPGSPPDTLPAT